MPSINALLKLCLLSTMAILLLACQPQTAPDAADAQVVVDAGHNPVILFSLDGFRYDYLEKYPAPHLNALAKGGVRAEQMYPSYPSKTFPNHISIVTGMYPANHGLVHNKFYDAELDEVYRMGKARKEPRWLQGAPLWILAEKQGVRTAAYFWPESDATIDGHAASHSFAYNQSTPYQDRIDQIVDWLKMPPATRPQFIVGYFSLVDSMGHDYGPDSAEVKQAVAEVDGYLGQLKRRLDNELDFPVNLVVVSDHGMIAIDKKSRIYWPSMAAFDAFKVVNGSTQLMLYAKGELPQADIDAMAKQLERQSKGRYLVYTKANIPAQWHYTGNDRIADILLEARPPATFASEHQSEHLFGGTHGYSPKLVPEMGAIFIANGPDFKKNLVIPAFDNIHVFPALASILGLTLPQDIDGDLAVLAPALK